MSLRVENVEASCTNSIRVLYINRKSTYDTSAKGP